MNRRKPKNLVDFQQNPAARLASSVEEVAERFGLGRTKLYALIKTGELASFSVGHRRLISEKAVEAFLARCQGYPIYLCNRTSISPACYRQVEFCCSARGGGASDSVRAGMKL